MMGLSSARYPAWTRGVLLGVVGVLLGAFVFCLVTVLFGRQAVWIGLASAALTIAAELYLAQYWSQRRHRFTVWIVTGIWLTGVLWLVVWVVITAMSIDLRGLEAF